MINKKIEIKTVTVEDSIVESITCDVCKTTYDINDTFEIQEFYHIKNTGGYTSIIGEGTTIELNICQHCFSNILGKYVRIVSEE